MNIFKSLILFYLIFFGFLLNQTIFSKQVFVSNVNLYDNLDVYHFRKTSDKFIDKLVKEFKAQIPSREGLDTVYASGSSELNFTRLAPDIISGTAHKLSNKILADIGLATKDGTNLLTIEDLAPVANKLTIIDLREEDHLFINGMPVSVEHVREASDQLVVKNTGKRLKLPKIGDTIEIYQYEKSKNPTEPSIVVNPQAITVKEIVTEKEIARKLGIGYVRVLLPDDYAPTIKNVDNFVLNIKKSGALRDKTWLHFHCWNGFGRTTTFMVFYDIMKNADTVSMDDIINRQYLLGGLNLQKIDLSDTKKLVQQAQLRLEMIKDFYNYTKEQKANNFNILFSKWLKNKKYQQKFTPDLRTLITGK